MKYVRKSAEKIRSKIKMWFLAGIRGGLGYQSTTTQLTIH
jgi:hypothetical protein